MRNALLNSIAGKIAAIVPVIILLFAFQTAISQDITYSDSWSQPGIRLSSETTSGIELTFSIDKLSVSDIDINGEAMKQVEIPGNFLPNDEGYPDLPAMSRFIAVPNGARVTYEITASRTEVFKNINIAPAPRIPKITEDGPLYYRKNEKIYSRDSFYPQNPVMLSETAEIRGVDAVILGITPFQYNPVTRELIVYRDLKVNVKFEGGNGQFGENRYRSLYWEPILADMLINYRSLPEPDYTRPNAGSRTPDYEYIIITPDDPIFISWADSLKLFRNRQGIHTGVYTTTDVGGNTVAAIESFVDDAFLNWDYPPAAVLLMGDYGTSGSTIISPIWDGYCVSDNIFADVAGVGFTDMPDVVFARMTAQNEEHLHTMVTKVLDYERNPPTDPDFYNHPITALGWQTERWFQICSETVGGYFKHVQGKDPVRINAIYQGTPGTIWSTATNTDQVVSYFGPSGQGYIPQTPAELGGWSGGTAQMVIDAINDGAFMLQHRDHGGETGWGEPDFSNTHINSLENEDLCFIFSINCLTGKYNWYNECFTEKFHRHTKNGHNAGALGLIAASEVSYSFVNDTYVWGLFDNMWPDFMPDEQTPPAPRGLLPAFGNAGGKYFLRESNWPYNTGNKEVTYHLFHHHGDAFMTLYSEVPQYLTVSHDNVMLAGLEQFTVTANDGALIALSVDGEIIGTALGTGSPVDITILPQYPPTMVDIVITKTNYYRYEAQIQVIPPTGPYVVKHDFAINDASGNNNGVVDYGESILLSLTMKNVGSEAGEDVQVAISTSDTYVTLNTASADFGTIPANEVITVTDGYAFDVSGAIPDNHQITFDIVAEDNLGNTWNSSMSMMAHAPMLGYLSVTVDDSQGNGNGKLDPGENANLIVSVENTGSADALQVWGELISSDPYVTIHSDPLEYGDIMSGSDAQQTFSITTGMAPAGYNATFEIDLTGYAGLQGSGQFSLTIGQIPVLVLDLDGNQNSGPYINQAIQDVGLSVEYTTTMPEDLDLYASIFVCLGTYSTNHILSPTEGQALADFVQNGGRLYMEGGDTWYYDDATAVHPYFKINGIGDGSSDLATINGQAGTFTEGMSFAFGGDNNWIDQIGAISPGFLIFKNSSPSYGVAVAHDGGAYKTIGSSFEFGGLADNESTKEELMEEYLTFFGFHGVPIAPPCPAGPAEACQGSANSQYTTHKVEGATNYIWAIDPLDAGTISGSDTIANVEWDAEFNGTASVTVCAMNQSGIGPQSEPMNVTIHEMPSALISGTANICPGDSTQITLTLTGVAPWYVIMNEGTMSMNVPASPHSMWVKPGETTDYTITTVNDANNCTNTGTGNALISLLPYPGTPDNPNGTASFDNFLVDTTTYTTGNTANAVSHVWSLNPSNAGTLIQNNTSCSVVWEDSFTGNAQLSVMGSNDCGEGPDASIDIAVENTFGLNENSTGLGINIYPNPTNGQCTVELSAARKGDVTIKVLNALGVAVYNAENLTFDGQYTGTIDLSAEPEGMYFIVIENDKGAYFRKLIIQK
ncbi:MAG: T9SS type A sorting domain-containing protein [Bacteroidetes bacterium]|nr:T9SS type A sorting domain-containing protein [Bacteroidota bacterium]